MLRFIRLIKTCCGGNADDVSERVEKKFSHSKASNTDVLILKSASKSSLPNFGSSHGLPSASVSRTATDQQPQLEKSETIINAENKKRKRKKRNKRPSDLTIEIEGKAKVEQKQEDSSLEQRKESPIEERKPPPPKPLKGILKNKGR
mmetsp:Transcript_14255/g.26892  ORF Transcript_14255/g.26892 Transcript_14255/m.26892 type:complete len:147 (+) Transcript_14255:274-714(+)